MTLLKHILYFGMKYLNIYSITIFAVLFSSQIYSQTSKWVWFFEDKGYNMYYDSSSIEKN